MATMKEITYAQAINDAMCEEMQRDENVFMMGEDIAEYCGAFGVSRGMLEKFGKDRIMNTPISEQAYVGAGIGAAVGLISGAIQDAAQKTQDRDQYFKDDVKNIYDEVIAIRQSMVSTGAEIAAERETTQMAFANLLKGEAANAPVYAYSAARDGGSLASATADAGRRGHGPQRICR